MLRPLVFRQILRIAMKGLTLLLTVVASASSWAAPKYELHEWGTFTTVSGSDGILLAGLEREEEHLPKFVHSHFGMENGQDMNPLELRRLMARHGTRRFGGGIMTQKGLPERPLEGVTVKMETPVIYFHSEEGFQAKVEVGFEGGTISQWYPQRSGGETLPEPPPPSDPLKNPTPYEDWIIDFSKGYRGSIQWDVEVLSRAASSNAILFKPHDSLGWARARVPGANVVRTTGGETEGYLFYRGVGNFEPGLLVTVDDSETLHLQNQTGGNIPYLIAFERSDSGTVRWVEQRDGLSTSGRLKLPESAFKPEQAGFCEPLYQAMKAGLVSSGLTDEESRAMVETWWNSYFEAPGLRIFWILPRETTDRILPLKVEPAPASTVRVLVGRSEILRPRAEQGWAALAAAASKHHTAWKHLVNNHRFGKAIEKRVNGLRTRGE
jgi:hypothetical protein